MKNREVSQAKEVRCHRFSSPSRPDYGENLRREPNSVATALRLRGSCVFRDRCEAPPWCRLPDDR